METTQPVSKELLLYLLTTLARQYKNDNLLQVPVKLIDGKK